MYKASVTNHNLVSSSMAGMCGFQEVRINHNMYGQGRGEKPIVWIPYLGIHQSCGTHEG